MANENIKVRNGLLLSSFVLATVIVLLPISGFTMWEYFSIRVSEMGISDSLFLVISGVSAWVIFNLVAAASQGWITRTSPFFGYGYTLAMASFLFTYANASTFNAGGAISGITQLCASLYSLMLIAQGVKSEEEVKPFNPKMFGAIQMLMAIGIAVAIFWPYKDQLADPIYTQLGFAGAFVSTVTTVLFAAGKLEGKRKPLFNLGLLLGAGLLWSSGFGQYNLGAIAANTGVLLVATLGLIKDLIKG